MLDGIISELRTMVNNIREFYNFPEVPEDLPPKWPNGQSIDGGRLYTDGLQIYWNRINLTAEQNILSPVEDTRHVRFLPFNQGPMELPDVSIVFNRHISQVGITTSEITLESGDDFTNADIARFSMFYIQGQNDRLIGNITHREYSVNSQGNQILRIRYDGNRAILQMIQLWK